MQITANMADVIKHLAWPGLIALIVLVYYRQLARILDALPEFIRRSYYRLGEGDIVPKQVGAQNVDGEKDGKACDVADNSKNGKLECDNTMSKNGGASFCEHQILERLKREYVVPVFEHRSIGVSNYYFDAVMEYQGRLYGVEIRGVRGNVNWTHIFENVQKVYDGFLPEYKKRFVFMVCVGGMNGSAEDGSALRTLAKRYSFPTVIKYY